MRNYFKKLLYLIVLIGFSCANAGSYEDFFTAVRTNDAPTITALLQRGFDPNTPNPQGLCGLFLALRESSLKAAQALLASEQTQLDLRNSAGETPLMMAALKGQLPMAQELVAKGADVNKTGWTPLHYAASGGNVAIISLLLENHAYIDAESPNGTTPLMMAAQYGSPEAVKLLLEEGADAGLKNQLGLSALDFATRGARPDAIAMIKTALGAKSAPHQ